MSHWRIWCCSLLCGLLPFLPGCERSSPVATSSIATGEVIERVTEKGPVTLKVSFTPRDLRLSDLGEMVVEVSAPREVEIKPPVFGEAVGDFLVRDYAEKTAKQTLAKKESATVRRFQYKLEPVNAGRHLVRSLSIEFVDHRPTSEQRDVTALIESEPFEVNVTSEIGDQVPNLADLEPMAPPRPLEKSTVWTVWGLALLAACGILAAVWLRRRKTSRIFVPPRKTPEEIAHAAFAALLVENLPAAGLFKDFYLRLTGIVRNYIEATTGLRAPEQTTEEFLQAVRLRNVFSPERSLRLKEFLEAADLVKYAGQQPDQDQVELSIARGREFVDLRSPISVAETLTAAGS